MKDYHYVNYCTKTFILSIHKNNFMITCNLFWQGVVRCLLYLAWTLLHFKEHNGNPKTWLYMVLQRVGKFVSTLFKGWGLCHFENQSSLCMFWGNLIQHNHNWKLKVINLFMITSKVNSFFVVSIMANLNTTSCNFFFNYTNIICECWNVC
jgi:hypothetical protein